VSLRNITVIATIVFASVAPALNLSSAGASSLPSKPASMTSCPPMTAGILNSAPRVPSGAKTVALTFDDGPGGSTQAIINILKSFHVRATFFNIGASMSGRAGLIREEQQDGFLLGDHSATHPYLPGLSTAQQTFQIDNVINRQYRLTGTVPCVFRPPYGSYNQTTRNIARANNQSLWMWSEGGGDWKAQGSGSKYWISYIERAVINSSRSQSHPVILLHNQAIMMPATVAALPTIIRSFLSRGYVFVDLLGRYGPPNTCGSPKAPTPHDASRSLASGTTLSSGSSLSSPNDEFKLTMKTDGNLVVELSDGHTVWSSGTSGNSGATAKVNSDGSLSVLSASSSVLWTSGSTHDSSSTLELSNNGTLAFVHGTTQFWHSGAPVSSLQGNDTLRAGWFISSPSGRCRLFFTASGRLQLEGADGQILWNNGVSGATGSVTVLQSDGNLVTRRANGSHAWATSTFKHDGSSLLVTNTGTLVLQSPSGLKFWVTE
jgi:peptidoglycan/xylan/chitin deacetylase (PgdA/CDA1 family)